MSNVKNGSLVLTQIDFESPHGMPEVYYGPPPVEQNDPLGNVSGRGGRMFRSHNARQKRVKRKRIILKKVYCLCKKSLRLKGNGNLTQSDRVKRELHRLPYVHLRVN